MQVSFLGMLLNYKRNAPLDVPSYAFERELLPFSADRSMAFSPKGCCASNAP